MFPIVWDLVKFQFLKEFFYDFLNFILCAMVWRCQITQKLNLQSLWAAMQVLGIEPNFSGRAAKLALQALLNLKVYLCVSGCACACVWFVCVLGGGCVCVGGFWPHQTKAFKSTGSIFSRNRIIGSFRTAWSTRKELVLTTVSKAAEKPCLIKQNTKPNKK